MARKLNLMGSAEMGNVWLAEDVEAWIRSRPPRAED
jgi:hypothetical protein